MERGYVGIGLYNSKIPVNLGTLIRSASCYGADFVFTVGKRYEEQASAVGHDKHIPIFHFENVEDIALTKSTPIVAVDMEGKEISEFKPPERVVYLLGAEDTGLPQEVIDYCNARVTIDTEYCLNVSTAGSIILHEHFR